MRELWITRINAALQHHNLRYSQFINALKKANIKLDRKSLSNLALTDPEVFKIIIDKSKKYVN